ncbi:amiloride-sensitive sodium channel subunit beta [Latimeria chalumnae]|uniref:amiloride-sensitive sodium channel subunit beta n=1 Tax=Latimeria chalumnae TaxID=7897 RepID=UPI00313D5601
MSVRKYFTRALHRLQKGPGYTYKELLVWYCDNTNTHGPKRIIKEGPKKQVLWFILTLTFTALIFWQWGLLIQTYLSYGVSTSLSMGFRAMEFPAVTVCNVNPMKYSKVKPLLKDLDELVEIVLERVHLYNQNGTMPSILPEVMNKSSQTHLALWNQVPLVVIDETDPANPLIIDVLKGLQSNSSTMNSRSDVTLVARRYKVAFQLCNQNATDCFYRNFTTVLHAINEWYTLHYRSIVSQLPVSEQREIGYSGEEFILTCLFAGEPCDYRNFTQMFHPTYGNCYIFNWGQDGNALISSNPGADFGLKLVLDINQEEYIPFLTTSAGARLMLHDQNTFPFLKDLGMYAMAGSQTSIGILVDEIQRIGAPYSQCTPYGSDVPVPNLYSIYNTSYSMQNCLYSCLQAKLVEKCGCGNYLHPLPDGAHSCNNEDNPSWAYCYYSLGDSSEYKDSCLQICEQPCNETQYRLTISMADWPSESSEDWIFHVLSYERDLAINRTMNRNGALKLNLYFQEFNYRTISESAATDISWLVSNLEGQFGFWMGGSILCIIEFLEIIIDCVWITIIKLVIWYRDRKHKKAQAQYSGPPPSVSQLARAHTDTGFQHDSTDINYGTEAYCNEAYIPPREPTPGTPPPNYDSLRVQPVENTEQISDSEENF